jgi:hypothetical protein
MLAKYFFVDNWVLGRLSNSDYYDRLVRYILDGDYTVILNSLSLTELYNPQPNENDRVELACEFYSQVPCVVVDPHKVKLAEADNLLNPLDELPIELDLSLTAPSERKLILLDFLRGGTFSQEQNIDLSVWSDQYKKEKLKWLIAVDEIIVSALLDGNLKKDKKGIFRKSLADRELFLLSLDLRLADPNRIDLLIQYRQLKKDNTQSSATRFASLLFWYLYVDEDSSNKIKHGGSDIGDIHQMTLIPYCTVFTLDKAMCRLVRRIEKEAQIISCKILTKPLLDAEISKIKHETA